MNKFGSCGNKLINTLGIKIEIDIKEEELESHEEYLTANDMKFESLNHQKKVDIDVKIEDETFIEDRSYNLNSDIIMMADINVKNEDHEDLIKNQNLTVNNDVIPKHISVTEEVLFRRLEKSKFPKVSIPKLNVEIWKRNFVARKKGINNKSKRTTGIFGSSPPISSKHGNGKLHDLKKRYRGEFKSTSGRELRKSTATKSGDAATSTIVSKFPYFKYLLFLKETTTLRDLKGSLPNTSSTSDLNPGKEDVIADSPISNSPKPATVVDLPPPPHENMQSSMNKSKQCQPKKKIQKKIESFDEKLLQIEEKKLKYKNSANDSDYQFLTSLLPYMRDVRKSRKLLIRGKLLQVFIDEQNLQHHLRGSRIANIHKKEIGNKKFVLNSHNNI